MRRNSDRFRGAALLGCFLAGTALSLGAAGIALSGCSAVAVADAASLLQVGVNLLDDYKGTANPAPQVVNEASLLQSAAQDAIKTDGSQSAEAEAAVAAFLAYLNTSAPGDGVTPTTVPTS